MGLEPLRKTFFLRKGQLMGDHPNQNYQMFCGTVAAPEANLLSPNCQWGQPVNLKTTESLCEERGGPPATVPPIPTTGVCSPCGSCTEFPQACTGGKGIDSVVVTFVSSKLLSRLLLASRPDVDTAFVRLKGLSFCGWNSSLSASL